MKRSSPTRRPIRSTRTWTNFWTASISSSYAIRSTTEDPPTAHGDLCAVAVGGDCAVASRRDCSAVDSWNCPVARAAAGHRLDRLAAEERLAAADHGERSGDRNLHFVVATGAVRVRRA